MPTVRPLENPPITEGLIDIRVNLCQFSSEKLHGIAEAIKGDYPERREHRQIQAQDLGLQGSRFSTGDGLQVAQFRPDGFTLNRLAPYTGWEQIFPEAMKLWARFVDVFEPEIVTRVAVRYINHITLSGLRVELKDYLRGPMPIPPELNHDMTSFLTSVVIQDPDSTGTVKVTQSLEPPHPGPGLVLLFDIDASQNGEWSPGDPGIEVAFSQLRALKNKVFFNSLTETLIESFE